MGANGRLTLEYILGVQFQKKMLFINSIDYRLYNACNYEYLQKTKDATGMTK